MKYFYKGNLNLPENKREKNGIEYYVRGYVKIGDEYYERYAVKTGMIGIGENLSDKVRDYVLPLYQKGDVIAVTEKVVSLAEGRVLSYKNKTPGVVAKLLGKCMKQTVLDWNRELKMQVFIDLFGLPKILFAAMVGAVGKAVKKNGWFYKVLGREASGLDGLYTGSDIPLYRDHAVRIPENYQQIMDEIEALTGCPVFVSDTNDATSYAYGFSDGVSLREETLEEILSDNPGGQGDELTPFIIIRRVSESEKESCVLPQEISREEYMRR